MYMEVSGTSSGIGAARRMCMVEGILEVLDTFQVPTCSVVTSCYPTQYLPSVKRGLAGPVDGLACLSNSGFAHRRQHARRTGMISHGAVYHRLPFRHRGVRGECLLPQLLTLEEISSCYPDPSPFRLHSFIHFDGSDRGL